MDILPLAALGDRIVILGPSNAGKSTLAEAIGEKQGLHAVHLDRLSHLPHTDWVRRPNAEFHALHAEAVAGDRWVMDGNYSELFPARFERATGVIVLRGGRMGNFLRYMRRTLFQPARAGHLDGARDSLKWEMVRWVLLTGFGKYAEYRNAATASGLPTVLLRSMRAVNSAYAAWGLERREAGGRR